LTLDLRVLVLGGTGFVGPAVVTRALAEGCTVTLFNRGQTDPAAFPDAEHRRGDRLTDLSSLTTGVWDAVIDVAAYHPKTVRLAVDMLGDRVGRYVFVSTLSVYADHSTTEAQHEDAAVLAVEGAANSDRYGAFKAACEQVAFDAYGDRAAVARAGMIVGPRDPTSRFVYWPRRIRLGGRVLAPGGPDDPVQFIDVRDLADWLLLAATQTVPTICNVTGPVRRFGDVLNACRAPGTHTDLVWVPTPALLAAGVDPWMGVPLWIGAPGWEAANGVDCSPAKNAGLRHRPLIDTIEGALADPGDDGVSPFPLDREAALLAELL
jgi:2'-hydroxyisoflavone reductase